MYIFVALLQYYVPIETILSTNNIIIIIIIIKRSNIVVRSTIHNYTSINVCSMRWKVATKPNAAVEYPFMCRFHTFYFFRFRIYYFFVGHTISYTKKILLCINTGSTAIVFSFFYSYYLTNKTLLLCQKHLLYVFVAQLVCGV